MQLPTLATSWESGVCLFITEHLRTHGSLPTTTTNGQCPKPIMLYTWMSLNQSRIPGHRILAYQRLLYLASPVKMLTANYLSNSEYLINGLEVELVVCLLRYDVYLAENATHS